MARLIVLDSGPLGLACNDPGQPSADDCRTWLLSLEIRGALIIVPEVADYEVRRKLIHIEALEIIRRLDDLKRRNIYVPITTPAMLLAAELWAELRKQGLPTAGPWALDADAILAGQAPTAGDPGDDLSVATVNVRHLNRFPGITAREWSTIIV